MQQCQSCGGFIPPDIQNCPYCHLAQMTEHTQRSPFRKWRNTLLALVSGGSLMLTMGCVYGPAPTCENKVDNDKDGYFICADNGSLYEDPDCDDSNKNIHPNAKDTVGDGIDQNCDGVDG